MVAFNKLKPVVVLWDQDGVQQNWTEGLNRMLLQLDPSFPVVHDEERLDYNHLMGPGGDAEVLREALYHPDLYRSLEPIESTVVAMKQMWEDDRVEPWICTMPEVNNPQCASAKLDSIGQYLGEEWLRRTVMMSDKTMLRGDLLIDDKPVITGSADPTWSHILFDRTYNRLPVEGSTYVSRMVDPLDWERFLPVEYRAAA